MRIRKVKTASGKYAIQVVSKHLGKVTVHKHIGSYGDDTQKEIRLTNVYKCNTL